MENEIRIIAAKDGWDVVYLLEGDGEHPDELDYEPVIAWAIDITNYDPNTSSHTFIDVDPITVENMMNWEMLRRPDGSFIIPHVQDINRGEKEALAYFQKTTSLKNKKK